MSMKRGKLGLVSPLYSDPGPLTRKNGVPAGVWEAERFYPDQATDERWAEAAEPRIGDVGSKTTCGSQGWRPHSEPGGLGAGLIPAEEQSMVASDARIPGRGEFIEGPRAEVARFLGGHLVG
jgi:hypothetical protein